MLKFLLFLLPSIAVAYGELDQEGCSYGGKILQPSTVTSDRTWQKVPADFTGEKICRHKNGQVSAKSSYEKGVRQGVTITFDQSGRKLEEYQVRNGNRNGLFKQFNPQNGKLQRELTYVEGRNEGLNRSYDSEGRLEQVQMVTPKNEGTRIYYTKKGEIQSVTCRPVSAIPEDDALCGRHGMGKTFKEHFEEGPVSRILQYRNLKLHGEVKSFALDGRLRSTETYDNGKSVAYDDANRDGTKATEKVVGREIVQTLTFPSGKVQIERRLNAANRALKEEKYFYENGNLSSHAVVEGEVTRVANFFDTGKKSCSFSQKGTGYFRTLEGVYECFNEKGKPVFRNVYRADRLDGEQNYFDEYGSPYRRQIYKNGNIQTTIEFGSDGKISEQYDHEPDGSRKLK